VEAASTTAQGEGVAASKASRRKAKKT
jgi:hypothetical protein